MRLRTYFAPASEVVENLKSKGGPSSFDYATRFSHPTLNNSDGKMHCCGGTPQQASLSAEIMPGDENSPGDENPESADSMDLASVNSGDSTSAMFMVDFNGTMRPCTNKFGRFLYYNCGRLNRRMLHNPALFCSKILTSVVIFYGCWYFMHLGGALATWKFPRVNQTDHPERLPDLIMDWLGDPENLPMCGKGRAMGGFGPGIGRVGMPGADISLGINLACILIEAYTGLHGHVHIQRVLHMSSMVFLSRFSVVGLTGLNQATEMTYVEALKYVFKQSPHRSCGDLIFSGHTALLTLWIINMNLQNGFVAKRLWLKILVFAQNAWGILLLVICGSHYTVDVALGLYFAFFVSEFYFVRSLNIYNGGSWLGRLIQRLEYWGDDWEKAGRLPGCLDEEYQVISGDDDKDNKL